MKDAKEFRLQLIDPAIGISLGLVPIIGLFALFGIAFGGLVLLSIKNPWVAGIYIFIILGSGGFMGFRAYKKWAVISARVLVADASIAVLNHDYELLAISYDTIKSYRYQSFNDVEELRITLRNNERLKIRASNKLAKVGNFAGMVLSFEMHLSRLNNSAEKLAIRREKTFFEKPISTVLLVAFTALLLFVFWDIHQSHKPIRGSIFVSVGSYFTYLSGWLAAAKQRRQA